MISNNFLGSFGENQYWGAAVKYSSQLPLFYLFFYFLCFIFIMSDICLFTVTFFCANFAFQFLYFFVQHFFLFFLHIFVKSTNSIKKIKKIVLSVVLSFSFSFYLFYLFLFFWTSTCRLFLEEYEQKGAFIREQNEALEFFLLR